HLTHCPSGISFFSSRSVRMPAFCRLNQAICSECELLERSLRRFRGDELLQIIGFEGDLVFGLARPEPLCPDSRHVRRRRNDLLHMPVYHARILECYYLSHPSIADVSNLGLARSIS